MHFSAGELAALVGGRIVGDPAARVTGYSGIESAAAGDITFASGEKYRALAVSTPATVVVATEAIPGAAAPALILVEDPNLAFAMIVDRMIRSRLAGAPGVHPGAIVDGAADVHPAATVHAGAVVSRGARVGARSVLFPGAYVGPDASVGEECVLHPNVVVMDRVRIGDRVIIHGGAVIGADGFGYATSPQGIHVKIPQTGTVVVEDDVEIGACTCIDRARFDETRIGQGTKIDNLVQIAHNVVIGPHSLIVSQVGIAGSARLGHHVVLAGHVGVAGHIEIGDGAQVSAYSGVGSDLEGGKAYMGVPARPIHEGKRIRVLEGRLPDIYARLREVERRIAARAGAGDEVSGNGARPASAASPAFRADGDGDGRTVS